MDKPKTWVRLNPEKVDLPLTIHEDYADGKSYDDGYYSGFLEGHDEAVGKTKTVNRKKPLSVSEHFRVPECLNCPRETWISFCDELELRPYDETHYEWTRQHRWDEAFLVVDYLIENVIDKTGPESSQRVSYGAVFRKLFVRAGVKEADRNYTRLISRGQKTYFSNRLLPEHAERYTKIEALLAKFFPIST